MIEAYRSALLLLLDYWTLDYWTLAYGGYPTPGTRPQISATFDRKSRTEFAPEMSKIGTESVLEMIGPRTKTGRNFSVEDAP